MKRTGRTSEPRWLVLNQSQSPHFQAMLERVAAELGPCDLLTGTPFESRSPALRAVGGPSYRRSSIISRALSWFRFFIWASWRTLSGPRPRLLFVTTNPPFLPHLAWLVNRIRHVPYVLLFWDIYPDHAVRQGWLKDAGFVARLWTGANRLAMRRAAAVVTIGRRMAGVLTAQAPGVEVVVVPNWADTDNIQPLDKNKNPFAWSHGQVGKLTVMYSGNVGRTHGVAVLVEAAALLQDLPSLWFLIIGDGLGLEAARRTATEQGVNNLTFLPFQPWEALSLSLATGDIAIILQESGSSHLSVPSKTYSLMAAGCALLACADMDSDLADLVESNKMGRVVAAGDAGALALAIRALHDNPDALAAARSAARRLAESETSVGEAARRFASLLKQVVGNST